ncbi:uncharacterized protein LOC100864475 isoform X3 [Apis florea]|uniref:uncharacterized protein LOC100864475 isoform X3 n=1 Tax=Apis florea TaxID=7463 RepID=UPI0012FF5267|nr:uncharacterized protein LOC100864475 isoform X3 [Apis florea]
MEIQNHFKQELKDEQAIQEDIYKMDIVYSEEKIKDTIINIQTLKEDNFLMDNFRAHKKLKTSLQNFLKRVEQETSIVHTMAQSELSNIYNTSCAWMKFNNWKHLTMKQLRHPQQFPFQISTNKKCYILSFFHSYAKRNSILHYVKTMDIQCFAQDKNKQMKQNIQRKKLEDIVGKLKEVENSNMNN